MFHTPPQGEDAHSNTNNTNSQTQQTKKLCANKIQTLKKIQTGQRPLKFRHQPHAMLQYFPLKTIKPESKSMETINELSGFLLVNKPVGISSFDCIRHIKRVMKRKLRIGHAGTLDNFASGLMIIAIGRQATKQLTVLSNANKEYVATGKLGYQTDTLDHTGNTINMLPWEHVTQEDLNQALIQLSQNYEQIPPAFSALKHQGTALYKRARLKQKTGESFDDLEEILQAKKRPVTIYAFSLDTFAPPLFTITTTVSKGTYIRSLINDLAQLCNSCATTETLVRTKIGDFSLEQAIDLEKLVTPEAIEQRLFN